MKRSVVSVLTTHTGSLPRPAGVLGLLSERGDDAPSRAAFDAAARQAVADAVERQAALGIDVVSDGEQSKPSYATYVKDRLTGFDGTTQKTTFVVPGVLTTLPADGDSLVVVNPLIVEVNDLEKSSTAPSPTRISSSTWTYPTP